MCTTGKKLQTPQWKLKPKTVNIDQGILFLHQIQKAKIGPGYFSYPKGGLRLDSVIFLWKREPCLSDFVIWSSNFGKTGKIVQSRPKQKGDYKMSRRNGRTRHGRARGQRRGAKQHSERSGKSCSGMLQNHVFDIITVSPPKWSKANPTPIS